ncbi:MAG: murein biosynthesis integral membrane protein MurJ [Acidobacteriales bacterium]|nr:murein biosynthesis integral membrane protein MurJ [Terriglobales bacterium]
MTTQVPDPAGTPSRRSLFQYFRPSHQHSAFSATVLLMSAVMLSRVIGYAREAYIAWAFGAGPQTDAYVAGFTIPDWLNYVVAGGTASITFISIYTRFVAQKKEEEAQRTFSVIITVMTAVLTAGVLVTEIFTPQIEAWWFKGFNAEQLALCVHLTRILLPAQIFFYVGGVVSAVLLSHRLFLFPAFGPLLYNVAIILGGVIGARSFGISSLAWGALAGSFLGPFLVNAIGAARIGTGYRLSFDIRNPAFREWVKLSIPLMLGVSLVTADDWILRYFASGNVGDITRINYAKRLFAVPIAVLGQATSQASLPFFARLFGAGRMREFAETVNASVYRISAASILSTSFMLITALPLIDLVYRRGRFLFSDSQQTAVYFFWFSLSLALWSAQGLYARAFYAAGNTLTPMVACTLITLASLPVYAVLYHRFSTIGLVVASDIGILANTAGIAILLNRRKLVPLAGLPWVELAKALATAVAAAGAGYWVGTKVLVTGSRAADAKALLLETLTWGSITAFGLWITRSQLPRELRRRKRTAYPGIAAQQAEELSAGIEP